MATGMAAGISLCPTWALSLAYTLHMLATVVWIGSLFYQSLFLLPAIRAL
jgi:uncharacterized membrane protein